MRAPSAALQLARLRAGVVVVPFTKTLQLTLKTAQAQRAVLWVNGTGFASRTDHLSVYLFAGQAIVLASQEGFENKQAPL
jgi:hypothetical protein